MSKIIRHSVFALLAIAAILVASCSLQARGRTHSLAKVSAGDTEQSVLERLGNPTRVELPGQPYLLYATQGCVAPCNTRLWWEWPLFRGIEAWSVELDPDGKVVQTAYWVSP